MSHASRHAVRLLAVVVLLPSAVTGADNDSAAPAPASNDIQWMSLPTDRETQSAVEPLEVDTPVQHSRSIRPRYRMAIEWEPAAAVSARGTASPDGRP